MVRLPFYGSAHAHALLIMHKAIIQPVLPPHIPHVLGPDGQLAIEACRIAAQPNLHLVHEFRHGQDVSLSTCWPVAASCLLVCLLR